MLIRFIILLLDDVRSAVTLPGCPAVACSFLQGPALCSVALPLVFLEAADLEESIRGGGVVGGEP